MHETGSGLSAASGDVSYCATIGGQADIRPVRSTRTPIYEHGASGISSYLGLYTKAAGLVSSGVFDPVLTPGDMILMMTWKSKEDADMFAKSVTLPPGGRLRHVACHTRLRHVRPPRSSTMLSLSRRGAPEGRRMTTPPVM